MGVQDNPACIGNCVITGVQGCNVLLERLVAEGYDFSEDQLNRINTARDGLVELSVALDIIAHPEKAPA